MVLRNQVRPSERWTRRNVVLFTEAGNDLTIRGERRQVHTRSTEVYHHHFCLIHFKTEIQHLLLIHQFSRNPSCPGEWEVKCSRRYDIVCRAVWKVRTLERIRWGESGFNRLVTRLSMLFMAISERNSFKQVTDDYFGRGAITVVLKHAGTFAWLSEVLKTSVTTSPSCSGLFLGPCSKICVTLVW